MLPLRCFLYEMFENDVDFLAICPPLQIKASDEPEVAEAKTSSQATQCIVVQRYEHFSIRMRMLGVKRVHRFAKDELSPLVDNLDDVRLLIFLKIVKCSSSKDRSTDLDLRKFFGEIDDLRKRVTYQTFEERHQVHC